MKQVDPVVYSGVDRAERRRVARGLAKAKERHQEAMSVASQLRAAGLLQIASEIEQATASPPTALLACNACHRPTPLCICRDESGALLDWGFRV
jgi:hypothetical protein